MRFQNLLGDFVQSHEICENLLGDSAQSHEISKSPMRFDKPPGEFGIPMKFVLRGGQRFRTASPGNAMTREAAPIQLPECGPYHVARTLYKAHEAPFELTEVSLPATRR